jgi:hypothetical protein
MTHCNYGACLNVPFMERQMARYNEGTDKTKDRKIMAINMRGILPAHGRALRSMTHGDILLLHQNPTR